MRISDWSSDVCSSDLQRAILVFAHGQAEEAEIRHGPEEDIEAFRGPRLGDQGRQVEAHDAAPFTAFRTVSFATGGLSAEPIMKVARQLATQSSGAQIGRAAGRGQVWKYGGLAVLS